MSQLEKRTESMGDLVPECVRHVKAYLAYEGDNPKYHQKAKISVGALSSYVKAEGTLTNRMALQQAAGRVKELPA